MVETFGFFVVEGPRATPAKHDELVSAFIDGAITIDSLGNGQSRARSAIAGDGRQVSRE